MEESAEERRAEKAERAAYHVEARRQRDAEESARARELIDRFLARAREAGLATEELTARPWSGRGRYRTGVVGWYLRRNHSVGVGVDGGFYLLNVAPVPLGRWRTVRLDPSPPPLEVGRGGRDGEVIDLADLLQQRLEWPRSPS